MSKPRYFRRYDDTIAEVAHAQRAITTEQCALILDFYATDTFLLAREEDVAFLQSIIPDSRVEVRDTEKNVHHVRIATWPHLKVMCLKCAPSNPCIWKYFDEQDNELFEYRLDTYSIFAPTASFPIHSPHASHH